MNPIGVHFIPTHTGPQHYQFIRDMQPGILKLVGSSTPDVQQIVDGFAAAPNALMYLRNVARSEQHDFLWREPAKAAHQHVTEWHADLDERYRQARERGLTMPPVEQIRITGVNEPVIELFARKEDMSNYDAWLAMMNERTPLLDTYMVEFGLEANRIGYGAGLGNISSGQPANKKPGEYATFDWFPKTRKLLESTRGKNAYACHEYWRAETGPEGHADWHAWRFMHLNVDCDIDILEDGVDQQITGEDPHGNRGWVGHMSASAYVDQHRRYLARARTDSRFRSATPFTLDGDKIWESFWVDYCMPEMVTLSNEVRASAPPTPPPPTNTTPLYVAVPNGANLRAEPNTASAILQAIPYADKIDSFATTITAGAEWHHVIAPNGQQGWILGALLSPTKPSIAPPITPPVTPSSGALDPLMLEAIVLTESGGNGFENSKLKIRMEAHLLLGSTWGNLAAFKPYFRYDVSNVLLAYYRRNESAPWLMYHVNQNTEWDAFDFACTLDNAAALRCTSMGAGQIMGFNAARIGYATPGLMFDAFSRNEIPQTIGVVNYCLSDPALVQAIRDKDFSEIALRYNGSSLVNVYAPRLAANYNRLGGT